MTYALLSDDRRKLNRALLDLIQDNSSYHTPKHSLALIDMTFISIVVQDGPYCPKSCAHCSGDFGPKKPKASLRLYEELMKQIPDTDISQIIITDGEPFHDIDRLENILKILDGMTIDLNTNGEFAKTVKDAEDTFTKLIPAGLNFKKHDMRSVFGTTNSTISVSADIYHGESSFIYALNILQAFHNVFKDLSVKDLAGRDQDAKHHVAIVGSHNVESYPLYRLFSGKRLDYFAMQRSVAKLEKKIVSPLKEIIPRNIYHHLKSGVSQFVVENMSVYLMSRSVVAEGRGKNILRKIPEAKKIFEPRQANSPLPVEPSLYLMSSGDVYDVPSFHCAVPGRLKGNIFQESLKQIIERTMQQPLYRVERERGIKGIYSYLYDKGIKIKANDHCELCKSIFADKETFDACNTLLSEPWKKYEHKLLERFNAK